MVAFLLYRLPLRQWLKTATLFSHDIPPYNDASPYQVWLQNNEQFSRCLLDKSKWTWWFQNDPPPSPPILLVYFGHEILQTTVQNQTIRAVQKWQNATVFVVIFSFVLIFSQQVMSMLTVASATVRCAANVYMKQLSSQAVLNTSIWNVLILIKVTWKCQKHSFHCENRYKLLPDNN